MPSLSQVNSQHNKKTPIANSNPALTPNIFPCSMAAHMPTASQAVDGISTGFIGGSDISSAPLKNPVGRPVTGTALTNAQRQKLYRQRHITVPAGESIPATIDRLAAQFDLSKADVTRALLRFALCNRNWGLHGFPGVVSK